MFNTSRQSGGPKMLSGDRTKDPDGKHLKNSVSCIKIMSEVPRSVENDYLEVLNIFDISQEQLRVSVEWRR